MAYLDNSKIKDNSITTGKLANGSVTAEKISANAVNSTKISDNAVTAAKIADGAVTEAKLDGTFAESLGDVRKLDVSGYEEHGFVYVSPNAQEAYNALNSGKLVTYNVGDTKGIAITGAYNYNNTDPKYTVLGLSTSVNGDITFFEHSTDNGFRNIYSGSYAPLLKKIVLDEVYLTNNGKPYMQTAMMDELGICNPYNDTGTIHTMPLRNGQVGTDNYTLSTNGDILYLSYDYKSEDWSWSNTDSTRPPLDKVFVNNLILNLSGYTETSPLRIVPEWFVSHATANSKVMVCGDKLASDGTFMVHIVSYCDGTNFTCWQTVSKKVDEFDGTSV